MKFAQYANSRTWHKGGPGERRRAPDEETSLTAYWTLEQHEGAYWSVTFDKRTATYTGKLWRAAADGDGEVCLRELTSIEALGLAMLEGLYCTGLEGSFKDRDPREGN